MEKIKSFVTKHPQWTSWIVLAIGMVAILVWSARDVGLLPGQWVTLIIATILVAGLAVWIIGWEDEEEEEEEPIESTPRKRGRRAKADKGGPAQVEAPVESTPPAEMVSSEDTPSEDVPAAVASEDVPPEDVPSEGNA